MMELLDDVASGEPAADSQAGVNEEAEESGDEEGRVEVKPDSPSGNSSLASEIASLTPEELVPELW